MILEPVSESDIDSLRELQPDGWPDIVPNFKIYTSSSFCFPVKAKLDDIIAGVGAVIKFGNTGWLAHIIVRPEHRNKGIGGAIVDHLVNNMKAEGCESVSLIATELGYPVYKRFGFVDQEDYIFFERREPLKNQRLPGNIIPYSINHAEKIFSLDRAVSGEKRFELLVDRLETAFVFERGGNVAGFYIPDLGEGLIIANDAEAGIELMKARLSNTNKSVLPVCNEKATEFLRANGFVEIKRAKRMILGKKFEWQPAKFFNRAGGNVG